MTRKDVSGRLLCISDALQSICKAGSLLRDCTKRLIVGLSVIMMLWQQTLYAQTQIAEVDLDIDPPVIDHEALEVGVAGEPQTFSAVVVDDKGIEYVKLFYRANRLNDYTSISMENKTDSRFTATVATELAQPSIEYYIEAADTGGNRVLKGFPFFPLVRNLDNPPPPPPVITTESAAPEQQSSGSSRLLYVLLGALAVGLLASAGGSSDGGGGQGGGGQQVPLTINISSPAD